MDFRGLPTRQIQIETTAETLASLSLTLDTLADRILTQARDLPAGTAGRDDGERQLRTLEQGRSQIDIANTLISLDGAPSVPGLETSQRCVIGLTPKRHISHLRDSRL